MKNFIRIIPVVLTLFLLSGSRIFSWQKKHFEAETLRRIARIQKAMRRLDPRHKKVFLATR